MNEKEILAILQETQDFDYENLVKVWNSYCEDMGYLENKVYNNTVENLIALLPGNPLDAFLMVGYIKDSILYFADDLTWRQTKMLLKVLNKVYSNSISYWDAALLKQWEEHSI